MLIALVALLVGLILWFIPAAGAQGGKVNELGKIIVFWAVYLLLMAIGDRHLRLADVLTLPPQKAASGCAEPAEPPLLSSWWICDRGGCTDPIVR